MPRNNSREERGVPRARPRRAGSGMVLFNIFANDLKAETNNCQEKCEKHISCGKGTHTRTSSFASRPESNNRGRRKSLAHSSLAKRSEQNQSLVEVRRGRGAGSGRDGKQGWPKAVPGDG